MERPTKAITLSCTLSEKGGGTGAAGELPVATTSTLGGIKASDSVVVDADGTAHAVAEISQDSFATDEEAVAAINDAFGGSAVSE